MPKAKTVPNKKSSKTISTKRFKFTKLQIAFGILILAIVGVVVVYKSHAYSTATTWQLYRVYNDALPNSYGRQSYPEDAGPNPCSGSPCPRGVQHRGGGVRVMNDGNAWLTDPSLDNQGATLYGPYTDIGGVKVGTKWNNDFRVRFVLKGGPNGGKFDEDIYSGNPKGLSGGSTPHTYEWGKGGSVGPNQLWSVDYYGNLCDPEPRTTDHQCNVHNMEFRIFGTERAVYLYKTNLYYPTSF